MSNSLRHRVELAKGAVFAALAVLTSLLISRTGDVAHLWLPLALAACAGWFFYKADALNGGRS